MLILACFIIQTGNIKAQYHVGNSNFTTISTSQGVTDLNCDIRNFNYTYSGTNQNSPLQAVAWSGTGNVYWEWTDDLGGPFYSGNISLPSGTQGADVVVLYNNLVVNEPYLGVVYGLDPFGPISSIVFKVYQFNPASPGFSLYSTNTYSCSNGGLPRIDADSRGYFAMAWDDNAALHTVAGKLSASPGPIALGQEKTLNIPSVPANCNTANYVDVALYGKNSTSSDNRIYYAYVRNTVHQTLTVQTQVFSDIFNGSGVPAVYSYYNYTASGNKSFVVPRIASNMYTGNSTSNNGAQENEYTVVCTMGDMTSNENSIFAVTSMQNSGQVTSEYNVTSDNFTGSPDFQASFFNVNSYTTPENNDITGSPISYNYNPVVAYDRDNDHVAICWIMEYGETFYPTFFPLGTFPAHVYANPTYEKNVSYPSKQADVSIGMFNGCEINGLDDTPQGSASYSTMLVAASCHNTNNLLYAWYNNNGDVIIKNVTSGSQPRLSENQELASSNLVTPNPVDRQNSIVHLNLKTDQIYSLQLFNLLGETVFSASGNKYELESQINSKIKGYNRGIYQMNILTAQKKSLNSKISIY